MTNDTDFFVSPMSDETMAWLNELFAACRRFGVDYYSASDKDRAFVETAARKTYGLKQAQAKGTAPSNFRLVERCDCLET